MLFSSVRPYYKDVPGKDKYWAAYISIMKSIGGRPHWAKVCDVSLTQFSPFTCFFNISLWFELTHKLI